MVNNGSTLDERQRNVIIHAFVSEQAYAEQEWPLSIRCAFGGSEIYMVDGVRHVVDDRSYVVLNSGQRYGSQIQSATPVERFCILFDDEFVRDVIDGLGPQVTESLNVGKDGIVFIEKNYRHDDLVSPILYQLRSEIDRMAGEQAYLEEKLYELLEALFEAHKRAMAELEKLPMIRNSSRVELYRRLSAAKDFIDDNIDQPITLKEMANVACLSSYYFLRRFEQVYHETPYQYLIRQRIARAQHLLTTTDQSITEISSTTGFQSLRAFSWLFRQRTGMSPVVYRGQSR